MTSPAHAEVVEGGFYGPRSEAWRLNREAMLLLGAGPRALLLQIAHPLVAAGVAEHSDFRSDPWARLSGTLASYLRIVYGSAEAARAEIRRLQELHRGIRGAVVDEDARARLGRRRYSALDPELSLWVHATLVDSTIVAYDAWIEPLSRDDRARYYAETLPVGRAFGIPASRLPADLEAFEAYLDSMLGPGGPVIVGDTARELADAIIHPPLGPAVSAAGFPFDRLASFADRIPGRAYSWLFWPAIGLLPASVREGFGFPWGLRRRAVAAWLVAAWSAWRPVLPPDFRQMPQALRAERRVGAGAGARNLLEA
ncbi:MAG TPA: oxygenase MpaB family protein [Candidatus Binatia bacterium]|nr:oxygenase MpaB family protein [Candidatus Binatia bacterium]